MHYYKIPLNAPKIGVIIDTEINYDERRLKRFNRLNKLFGYIFETSKIHNIPILNILATLYPEQFQAEIDNQDQHTFETSLENIKREIIITNFNVNLEFRQFTDFVLHSARNEIVEKHSLSLPDRFKSHYFFESIDDCLRYKSSLYHTSPCTIIEADFIDQNRIFKMDNELLTHFENHYTADDYYIKAKDFLMQKSTENPLFEIVFQGKYRIVEHHPTL